ncbi:MAG TPA: RHS repeat-associated core domain-containing protein [Candidatus Sulfotelmatobacter sp.]|nr:RHS repeat-associated core domain-containing protein [Candidatus Sulfotelmatobacter sp.]
MIKVACPRIKESASQNKVSTILVARFLRCFLFVVAGLFLLSITNQEVRAQEYLSEYGQPDFSSPTPVEYGYVEQANGHLHLEIPLGDALPQRGNKQGIQFRIVYDSNIWSPAYELNSWAWTPLNVAGSNAWPDGGGWHLLPWFTGLSGGASNFGCSVQGTSCFYVDPDQTTHYFPTGTGNAYASDSSGYYMQGSVVSGGDSGAAVYGPDGTLGYFYFWGANSSPPAITEDPNGNYLYDYGCNAPPVQGYSYHTDGICDTTGRTILDGNDSGIYPNHTEQTLFSVPNSQGSTSNYVVNLIQINVSTNFRQSGIAECSGQYCIVMVVESISLPDGTSYNFKYDCDSTISGQSQVCSSPAGQTAYYGELTSMTLPSGGQITYTYQTFSDAYKNEGVWLNSRSSAGGTWTYTPHVITNCNSNQVGCQQSLTTTSPGGNTTVTTFTLDNGAWPTQVQTSGGPTVTTTWDMSNACVIPGCIGHSYIRKTAEATTVPGPGGASITKKTTYSYDSIQDGLVTAVKEWGYYPGASPSFPSVPDRATYTTYYSPASSPVSTYGGTNVHKPLSVTLCSNSGSDSACPGGGSKVSQTVTTYDSVAPSSLPGVAAHDDYNYPAALTVRGNPTNVQQWVSGSTYVTTQLSYDMTGQVLQSVDPKGNPTGYSYADNYFSDNGTSSPPAYTPNQSTNAYPTTITGPSVGGASFKETFGYYYGSGKTAFSTDFNGQATYYHFMDALDRSTSTVFPIGWNLINYTSPTQADTYVPVADTNPSTGCTSCRHTQIDYDGLGRKVSELLVNDPGGETGVDTSYDSSGRVESTSHPYGPLNPTKVYETYGYDMFDRTTSDTHPDGQSQQTAYGPSVSGAPSQQGSPSVYGYGYPVLTTDEVGNKTQEWMDGFGRIIEVDEPPFTTGTTSHGSFSVCCSAPLQDQGTVYLTVGTFNTQVDYGYSSTTRSVASALASALNGSNLVTASASGSTVNMTSIATGTIANYSFSSYSVSNTGMDPPLFTVYPSDGTMCGGSNGGAAATYYSYDAADRLTQVVEGLQMRTSTYDGLGRTASAKVPEISNNTPQQCTVSFTYDNNGNVLSKTAPAPNQTSCTTTVTTNFSYDALNRVTGKTYSNGMGGVSYSYDQGGAGVFALGRLTSMSDPSGSESYTYDKDGRVIQVQKIVGSTAYTTGYQLNVAGQHTQVTYPSNRSVTQSYDSVGHVVGVASGSTNYVTVPSPNGYDAEDRVLTYTYGNGIVANLGYSLNRSQLTTLNYTKSAQTLFGLSYWYQYDSNNCQTGTTADNGQIDCITDSVDSGRTANYTYDALARVTSAKTNGSTGYPQWGLSWSYDRYGNRLSETVTAGSGPSNSLSFGSSSGALTNRPDGYSFDASGNLLNDASNTLTYDAENRVVSSSGGGGGTYTYDGNGLRVEKTASGTSTVYIYAGSQVIAEYDNGAAPSAPSREYIYAFGQRAAKIEGGATDYYQTDHLSPRIVTDGSGNVVGQLGHYPFGELWYDTGTTTKWKFTSYERDAESGNDYADARIYINRFGRFMTTDPLGSSVTDPTTPQSWNLYSYGVNNPLTFIDPTGMECVWDNGSFDSEDDPETGSPTKCQSRGGTWIELGQNGNWSGQGDVGLKKLVNDIQNDKVDSVTVTIPGGAQYTTDYNSSGQVAATFTPSGTTVYGNGTSGLKPANAGLGLVAFGEGACVLLEPCGAAEGTGAAIFGGLFLATVGVIDFSRSFAKGGKQNIPPTWITDRPRPGESADDFARRVCAARYGNVAGCGSGPGSEFNRIKKWAQDWINKHG